MYKKILLICSLALLLAAGCTTQTQESISQTAPPPAASEAKFSGTIRAIKNEQPYDGALSIQVDDKWVIIGGGLRPTNAEMGTISGINLNALDSNVGLRVEVYAAKLTGIENTYSIMDNSKYYVQTTK